MSTKTTRDDDLVSVIIPHRNQQRWLAACLDSCLAQSHPRLEIILIDDASDGDVAAIVARARKRARQGHEIHLHRLASIGGPGRARNAGLAAAKGAYVQFLDADDYIAPKKIETQLTALRRETADAVLSRWRYVVSLGPLKLPVPKEPRLQTSELLRETIIDDERWFPLMACLFTKSLLDRVGPWSETDSTEDREYRYRILLERGRWAEMPTDDCFFYYRLHLGQGQYTTLDFALAHAEARRRSDLAHLERVKADLAAGRLDEKTGKAGLAGRLRLISDKLSAGTPAPARSSTYAWMKRQLRRVTSPALRVRLIRSRSMLKFFWSRWLAAKRGHSPREPSPLAESCRERSASPDA